MSSLLIIKKGEVRGIKRCYLQNKALDMANNKEWESCVDYIWLLIFGVVLFPCTIDYIDHAAISVFWGTKTFNTNLTPALLVDIYYTIHTRYEKKRGTLNCCIPLLYSWFLTYLYNESYLVPSLTRYEWPQKLRSLTASSVLWYARKLDISDIVYSCGDFPLIESQGYVNYNHTLAIRQLGYPLEDKPSDEQLQQLIIHDMGRNDRELLNKIIQAWSRVKKRKAEKKNVVEKEPYTQWVLDRVQTKLLLWLVF